MKLKYNSTNKSNIENLMVLILFGIFAACVLTVLLTGADAYNRLTKRDQLAYDQRTYAQYISTKVRQADSPAYVSVDKGDYGDALMIKEEIEGYAYYTLVYCYDGWIRELFVSSIDDFSPEEGEKILKAESLSIDMEEGFLNISIEEKKDEKIGMMLAVRGAGNMSDAAASSENTEGNSGENAAEISEEETAGNTAEAGASAGEGEEAEAPALVEIEEVQP